MRKTGPIAAAAALALTACDPAPPPATLTAPVTDVAQLVAAVRAGIAEAPSAAFTTVSAMGGDTTDASGSFRFDGTTCSLKMVADGYEYRVLGKRNFTHTPEGIPGKEWVGTNPDSEDPISRIAAAAGSPLAVKVPDLCVALAEIERTGRIVSAEQTRLGELPVNHYRLELDPAKAPDLFLEFAEVPVKGKPAEPRTVKLPAELWLDAARRPARFTIDLSAGFRQGGSFTGTADYRDWGEPVDIQPPPADQVVDAGELMKQLGR